MDITEIVPAVEREFPAPSFRENQKAAIVQILKYLEVDDADVVVLSAPTGAGKSLILNTVLRVREGKSFFTTPLNALVDQLENDGMIRDSILTVKGRNNYNCIHPEDVGTPVHKAICQREQNFECEFKDIPESAGGCPYYGRMHEAMGHPQVVTNLSLLMAHSMIPAGVENTFSKRSTLAVDECQNIEDFATNYISFTASRRTLPGDVWDDIEFPPEEKEDDMPFLVDWLQEEVMPAVVQKKNELEEAPLLDVEQLDYYEDLQQFITKLENFLSDVENNAWVATIEREVNKNAEDTEKVQFQPVYIGRFLKRLLWSFGDKIVLSSATVPGGGWLEEIGLGDKHIEKVNVPSTFPVENRPISTRHTVGKMTAAEREGNKADMAEKIFAIANHHEGERGFVHCRSYNMIDLIREGFREIGQMKWWSENVDVQDKRRREESLEDWLRGDKQVFMSVAMDEGIDLDYDKARWQVLAKTLYKHMGDKRVAYRMGNLDFGPDSADWMWYNSHAAVQIQQAYGRAVRAPDDEAVFYILDESALGIIRRSPQLFEEWFLEAVQGMNVDPSKGR